jgi:prepilin peptidase CpaA
MEIAIWAFVFAIVFVSGYTDVKYGRVFNWVTYPAALVGIGLNGFQTGPRGLLFGVEGLAVGFGVMLIPYLMALVGGGDVKLLAAVGAFLGPTNVLWVAALGCIAGGVVAIGLLLWRRQLVPTLINLLALPITGITSYVKEKGGFPFALNFALGAVILRLLMSTGAM